MWAVIRLENLRAAIARKMWVQFLDDCSGSNRTELVYFPIVAKIINGDHVSLAVTFKEIYGDLLPWTQRKLMRLEGFFLLRGAELGTNLTLCTTGRICAMINAH